MITITISDDNRSFSATVEPTIEEVAQAVDAALQGLGWHYNTVRNIMYEIYLEKMKADGLLTYESQDNEDYGSDIDVLTMLEDARRATQLETVRIIAREMIR